MKANDLYSFKRKAFATASVLTVLLTAARLSVGPAGAQSPDSATATIYTLGTAGGPPPRNDRSQPANALVVNGTAYLIDLGENAVRQISRAGINVRDAGPIFITHNHSDHTMGLPALVATQWEAQRRAKITIIGPPGTGELVDGMMAFLKVNSEIRQSEGYPSPISTLVDAKEVKPGLVYQDVNVRVTAVPNTHYNFPAGSVARGKHGSYSYRFDTKNRSVIFTGDTGVSPALVTLAHDADVLVTEVSDAEEVLSLFKRTGRWAAKTPEEQREWLRHQRNEHLSPDDVGHMAAAAGVKMVVLTHLTPTGIVDDNYERWAQVVRRHYKGRVVVANDLDRF